MPKITVNNINLYYEGHGSGEPLVFIHGFAADHLVFMNMLGEYQNNYEVILIDNRGSGQSDCPDSPYSIEMMAGDVAALCRKLNLGPCHFVGHSMGGMILQQIAHDYPDQVRSALLCNTDLAIDIRYALAAKARLEYIAKGCSPQSLVEGGLGWTFSSHYLSQEGMVKKLVQMRLANPFPITPIGYKHQLHALLAFDSSAWIHKIKSRCLVVDCDQDIIMPPPRGEKIAAQIPNAQYHCIAGSGHVPFFEQPETFHAILKGFLTS